MLSGVLPCSFSFQILWELIKNTEMPEIRTSIFHDQSEIYTRSLNNISHVNMHHMELIRKKQSDVNQDKNMNNKI